MPTLEHDSLVFRFPQIEQDAKVSIDFQRTLRIPDGDKTYPLPPGLGSFPVRHTEDYPEGLSQAITARGGVILPMWQAEAMWLNFTNDGPDGELDFPVAIKIAAGKINAITGERWRPGLYRDPQDYVVSPDQPWLDGFAIEKGVIRQFVAMPLNEGFTAEEQLTGQAEWGGLQIQVIPLKKSVWKKKLRDWKNRRSFVIANNDEILCTRSEVAETAMGLAPGGRMEQEIYPDYFELEDWDLSAADRVFVSLIHAKDWKSVTGEDACNLPPTSKEYAEAGLPWFQYYGIDQNVLLGSDKLASMKSVGTLFKDKTGAQLPGSADIDVGYKRPLYSEPSAIRAVKNRNDW